MPRLVVGDALALLLVHHAAPALQSRDRLLYGLLEVGLGDALPAGAYGHQGRLVADVGKIRTGKSCTGLCYPPQVD